MLLLHLFALVLLGATVSFSLHPGMTSIRHYRSDRLRLASKGQSQSQSQLKWKMRMRMRMRMKMSGGHIDQEQAAFDHKIETAAVEAAWKGKNPHS